jgi:transcriptional regulator with PAS, ATPase and Fis domain
VVILQEREKNILAVLSILAVVAIYWFLLKPAQTENHQIKADITRYQQELDEPSVTPEKLAKLEEIVGLLNKEIASLQAQIPEHQERGFLIRDLEQLAKKNSIELISFLPKEAIPVTMSGKEITPRSRMARRNQNQSLEEMHAKVLKTVITIDSKGKFENYNKFFADVLTYYKAVEVSDLIIAKGASAAGIGEDKRFSQNRSKDPLADARNTQLSVSFTLLAYTGIPSQAE